MQAPVEVPPGVLAMAHWIMSRGQPLQRCTRGIVQRHGEAGRCCRGGPSCHKRGHRRQQRVAAMVAVYPLDYPSLPGFPAPSYVGSNPEVLVCGYGRTTSQPLSDLSTDAHSELQVEHGWPPPWQARRVMRSSAWMRSARAHFSKGRFVDSETARSAATSSSTLSLSHGKGSRCPTRPCAATPQFVPDECWSQPKLRLRFFGAPYAVAYGSVVVGFVCPAPRSRRPN